MIVKKMWLQQRLNPSDGGGQEWTQEGWYLFGFIPLYIVDLTVRERRK